VTQFPSCVPRRGEVCSQFDCPAHLLNPAVRLGRRRRRTNDALRRDRGCQFLIQDPWTLEEIAEIWGFSREHVRQIEQTALLKYILHLVGMQAELDLVDPAIVALYRELKNRKEHRQTKQRELSRGGGSMIKEGSEIVTQIEQRTGQTVTRLIPKGNLLMLYPSRVVVRVIQAYPRKIIGPRGTRLRWTVTGTVEPGTVALVWLHGDPPVVMTYPPRQKETHYSFHVTERSLHGRWANSVGWGALKKAVKEAL